MNVQDWLIKTKTKNPLASGSTKLAQSLVKDNEEIKFAFNANVGVLPTVKIDSAFNLNNRLNGVIVLTNDRLIFASKTLWEEEIKYLRIIDIQSVDIKKTMMMCSLRIKGITESFVIDGTKDLLLEFQSITESLIDNCKSSNNSNNSDNQTKNTQSVKEQLQDLKDLLDAGIITQEEFDKKKKQLLGI